MATQPRLRIGIIGAGNIGGTLTRRLTRLGHDVAVANSRGPESLAGLAAETGATAVTVNEAARGRDVVIVTIPQKNIPDLPAGLFDGAPDNLVVVDTGNYYPRQRDGRIDGIEDGLTESRWVEQQLGHPVVKAFNNIHAQHLMERGQPAGTPGRIALPVAGDDPAAKAVVLRLIDELGFRRRRRRGPGRVLAATARHPGLRHESRRRGRSSGPERGEPRAQAGVARHRE